ncbi:RpiB/LacA/LacB family sugar-phosphate isomerase [bacterium]|nr:RpiB/LacA/LacB family sugar-phosphate isomerase [bacterium]
MEQEKINEIMAKVVGELGTEETKRADAQTSLAPKSEIIPRQESRAEDNSYPVLKSFKSNTPVLITEEYLKKTVLNGGTVLVDGNYIVTPSARDFIRRKNVQIKATSSVPQGLARQKIRPEIAKTIAIGSDHRGYSLKEMLKKSLTQLGYTIIDVGTDTVESCDYPDYAIAVAKNVSSGQAYLGIAIDSAGIGSAISANKIDEIRAAVCWDNTTAEQSRMHNNANVMCIGADNLAPAKALSMAEKFIATQYIPNERYDRRLEKIADAEKS